jgi:hypothetical protein
VPFSRADFARWSPSPASESPGGTLPAPSLEVDGRSEHGVLVSESTPPPTLILGFLAEDESSLERRLEFREPAPAPSLACLRRKDPPGMGLMTSRASLVRLEQFPRNRPSACDSD